MPILGEIHRGKEIGLAGNYKYFTESKGRRIVVSETTIEGKTILVTGGTGSLGQAFVAEALKEKPRQIRVYSRGEYAQAEMKRRYNDDRLRFLIGDVRDKDRLYRACNNVDIVVHAAALKRVEICEYNPSEAHKTNVDGSENVVNAAIDNHVEKVLAISSDKAVHPISVYGVTKQHMEKIIIGGNIYGDTKFSCIRSGNFNNSKGNVIQTWQKQLEEKGEIEVTDMEMSRFWIGLNEVAQFVVECLGMMQGSEIFVPKMPRVELRNIMEKFDSAVVKIIGKRPGEKLHELLFNEGESPEEYEHYWVVRPPQARG